MEEKLSEKELLEIAVKLFCAYPNHNWIQSHAQMADYQKYAEDLVEFFTGFHKALQQKLRGLPE